MRSVEGRVAGREVAVRYAGRVGDVREARHTVASFLRAAHCPDPVVDDAALVASELAANAVQHTDGGFVLRCRLDEHLSVEVDDDDPLGLPPEAERPAPAIGGRGLLIVAALARGWGVVRRHDGKTVWCDLPLDPATIEASGPEGRLPQ